MISELFPGFKVPPTDPSRDLRPKLTITPPPLEDMEPFDSFEDIEEPCKHCDGWGYTNCFCGGDLCVCQNNGEMPCWFCC